MVVLNCVKTVSYTHLDVYKRQPQAIPDEGLYFQEMLDYSWQQNKHGKARGQIIAYREKGQVMVFNC